MVIWSYPTRILFGVGVSRRAAEEAARAGMKRPLVVSDRGVAAAGLLDPLVAGLEGAGLAVRVFTEVSSNPTEGEVEAAARALADHGADGVVALGGGSPMDVAKLVVVRHATPRPWEELDDAVDGGTHIPAQVLPVITLPTTAGTGSEVGRSGVLTARSTGRKTVVFAPQLMPRAALLDPELTLRLPPAVTAATGFDALTHCVEAYLAQGDHPMADAIALAGIDRVAKFLPVAVERGEDIEARGELMKAAMMGAVAFQKGLGACHSLAHPLSSEHGLHHGLANALCLPAVLDFVEGAALEKVLHVGLLLGGEPEAGSAGAATRRLRERVGLPAGLASQGLAARDLERLAPLAHADACHRSSPRPCSVEDLAALYRASL